MEREDCTEGSEVETEQSMVSQKLSEDYFIKEKEVINCQYLEQNGN